MTYILWSHSMYYKGLAHIYNNWYLILFVSSGNTSKEKFVWSKVIFTVFLSLIGLVVIITGYIQDSDIFIAIGQIIQIYACVLSFIL